MNSDSKQNKFLPKYKKTVLITENNCSFWTCQNLFIYLELFVPHITLLRKNPSGLLVKWW